MKQILLIINPISGNKTSTKVTPIVIDTFKNNNYDVDIIYSKYKGHIEKIEDSEMQDKGRNFVKENC